MTVLRGKYGRGGTGMKGRNILITGIPGVGKTTFVKSLCAALAPRRVAGFYTGEIREGGVRKGFEIVSLDGVTRILAHVDNKSPYRVGRYGVDVHGLEYFLRWISFHDAHTDLAVIDEVGKMECFSRPFRNLVTKMLESSVPLVATIALRGGGFIAEVKMRKDITLLELTRANRDDMLPKVLALLAPKPRGEALPHPPGGGSRP